MAYTTYTEVQGDFKDITFAAGFNITDTKVTEFIVEADSLINSYVGSVYQVPVTTGDAVNLLKLLSRSLVASRIKKVLGVKQNKSVDANQDVTDVLLSATTVMKILKDIQQKNNVLAGATLLDVNSGFYNNNVSNQVQPKIRKDERQW